MTQSVLPPALDLAANAIGEVRAKIERLEKENAELSAELAEANEAVRELQEMVHRAHGAPSELPTISEPGAVDPKKDDEK